ncbi:unnamed protein product [Rotaria sordida]|uniref:PiggyBac transposable element-derived protein domain-containing protein n=1 Tax=Rotaria sordida TaxID=392033 RepID=A0A819LTW6_9BILA|nr:unnamed protein product [Rotaria sordida]CAF3971073.1 unnamed protein product [Rotaria sordida]
MRNGELLMVKFADKKATGDKEIYVIDSKGTANIVQVERFEKGGVKKYILKPSSFVDYNRNMGGVDLSDSSLHHACMDRKSYRWFVKLSIHFFARLLFNAFVMHRTHDSKARFSNFLSYFVRETMESTGICRKPLAKTTPPQKRANSLPSNIIPQKLVKVQHFSNNEVHKQAQELELQIASHSQSTWSTIQIKERKKYEIAIQNLILSAVYLCQQDQPIN